MRFSSLYTDQKNGISLAVSRLLSTSVLVRSMQTSVSILFSFFSQLKCHACLQFADALMSMTLREGFFDSKKRVKIKESMGRVCGDSPRSGYLHSLGRWNTVSIDPTNLISLERADIAVQSTHKVLCSLTQSSMLHAAGNRVDKDRINTCLRALQTTSPSYLLLASLDAARAQLSDKKDTAFNQVLDLAMKARKSIMKIPGISLLDSSTFPNFSTIDPMRVTVSARNLGLSGFETDETLYAIRGIVSELTESHTVTYCLSLGTCKDHVHRLVAALEHLTQVYPFVSDSSVGKTSTNSRSLPFAKISMGLTPREAFFASKTRVNIKESIGKVVGEAVIPYPPGVPMLIPGEVITREALDKLEHIIRQGACVTGASDPSFSSILICDL